MAISFEIKLLVDGRPMTACYESIYVGLLETGKCSECPSELTTTIMGIELLDLIEDEEHLDLFSPEAERVELALREVESESNKELCPDCRTKKRPAITTPGITVVYD